MLSSCLVLPKQDRGAHLQKLANLYESPGQKAMTIQKANTRDNKRKKREGTDKGRDRRGTRPIKESVGGGQKSTNTKTKRRRERRVGKTKTQECSCEKKVRGWDRGGDHIRRGSNHNRGTSNRRSTGMSIRSSRCRGCLCILRCQRRLQPLDRRKSGVKSEREGRWSKRGGQITGSNKSIRMKRLAE